MVKKVTFTTSGNLLIRFRFMFRLAEKFRNIVLLEITQNVQYKYLRSSSVNTEGMQ